MNYNWDTMTPLEEVYAIRHRIAEKYNYDLDAIFDAGIKAQRDAESRGKVFESADVTRRSGMGLINFEIAKSPMKGKIK